MIDESILIKEIRQEADTRFAGLDSCVSFEEMILWIEQQPKIGGWIPCSERMPTKEECIKNDCRFIVSDGNRVHQGIFDYEINHFVWHSCSGIQIDRVTIAWMPLPDLYKEEV